jgi:hypothetical protein
MTVVRKLGAVTIVVLGICLASCSSTPIGSKPPRTSNSGTASSTKGVISGFADSCSGLLEHTDVKVLLLSGHSLLATETIRSGADYRFSVRPGSYRVMADHRVDKVVVRAGHTTTASLLAVCL